MSETWLSTVRDALTGAKVGSPVSASVGVAVAQGSSRGRRAPRRPGGATTAASAQPDPAEARFVVSFEGGVLTSVERDGDGPAPGAVFSLQPPDALALVEGREEPSVLFMQGRMKVDGDMGTVLALLAASAGPGYERRRAEILATLRP